MEGGSIEANGRARMRSLPTHKEVELPNHTEVGYEAVRITLFLNSSICASRFQITKE